AGCGEAGAAAATALEAARAANDQLAFDRAAALYGVALEHGRFDDAGRTATARQQALALQNAGHRRESGEVLLRAAACVSGGALAEALRREAGAHLLLSGDVDKGIDLLTPALARVDLRVSSDFADIVESSGAALRALAAR